MTGAGDGGSERRRHARFFVDGAGAEIRPSGLAAILGLGRIRGEVVNLSDGGIRVSVPAALAERRKVRCRVRTERFEDPLEAAGEVRWCGRDLMSENGYLVGILFQDLEARQSRKIATLREWFSSAEYRARRRPS